MVRLIIDMTHIVNTRAIFINLLILIMSFSAQASELKHDGFLRLYNFHLNETLEIAYEKDHVPNPEAVKRVSQFLRSRDNAEVAGMNLDLIHLLDHLADHFGVDTLEIISGYRRPEFNEALRAEGRNVAKNSYHTKGMASDIHMDEITEKKLVNYVRRLGRGGVGYYPDLLMVHVDVGRVHTWQENEFTDRTDIGEFNKECSLDLKTDYLFYFDGQIQNLTVTNPEQISVREKMGLEHFFRGKWFPSGDLVVRNGLSQNLGLVQSQYTLPMKALGRMQERVDTVWMHPTELVLPYGKFRWKLETIDGKVQYSNEFYLKRM